MKNTIKVAVVGGHVLIRKSLAYFIKSFGFFVHFECNNGNELIAKLDEKDLPDIVLMDIDLSQTDSFDTAYWLMNNHPSVSVLALSEYDNEYLIIQMLKMGARGYILKDSEPEDLKAAIISIITRGFYNSDIFSTSLLHRGKLLEANRKKKTVSFSENEIKFLKLASTELTYKEIAHQMRLSERTIDKYREQLCEKIGVETRVGLVLFAFNKRIVNPETQFSAFENLEINEQNIVVVNANQFKDELNCTVYGPERALLGESLLIQVFAHTIEQSALLPKIATKADEDAKLRASARLQKKVGRETQLSFGLLIPGLEIDDPMQFALWDGSVVQIQFGVQVPLNCQARDMIGTVIVSENSVPIGHLKFKLKILPAASQMTDPQINQYTSNMIHYKHAFISYASQDRGEVLKRVQMLNLVKLKFFQDLLTLEPGEKWETLIYEYIDKSDVFFLFWSQAASQSDWVQKEVEYAVKRKAGKDEAPPEIIPVIIEGPPPAKPPTELSFLHFNDKFIYFISNQ